MDLMFRKYQTYKSYLQCHHIERVHSCESRSMGLNTTQMGKTLLTPPSGTFPQILKTWCDIILN